MKLKIIEETEYKGKGVTGLPDTPGLSTEDMQKKFDELSLDILIPALNGLIKELLPLSSIEGVENSVTDDETKLVTGAAICRFVEEIGGIGGGGGGDMFRAVFDKNRNGIVDDSEKLGGNLPEYYQSAKDESLETESKTIIGAINELAKCFQSVSNGKKLIANAITDYLCKAVPVDGTFREFANAIKYTFADQFDYGNEPNEGVAGQFHVYFGYEMLSESESQLEADNIREGQKKLRVYTTTGARSFHKESAVVDAPEGTEYYKWSAGKVEVLTKETGTCYASQKTISTTLQEEVNCEDEYFFVDRETSFYYPVSKFTVVKPLTNYVENVVSNVEITDGSASDPQNQENGFEFNMLQMCGTMEFLIAYRTHESNGFLGKTYVRMGRVNSDGSITLGTALELAAACTATVINNAFLLPAINSVFRPTDFLVLNTAFTIATEKTVVKYTHMWCNVSTLVISRDVSNSATKWTTLGTHPETRFAIHFGVSGPYYRNTMVENHLAYIMYWTETACKAVALFDNFTGVKTYTLDSSEKMYTTIECLLPNGKALVDSITGEIGNFDILTGEIKEDVQN